LKNNGKNLKELNISKSNNLINLAIVKFCPNLEHLHTGFKNDELETLKVIFNGCKYLESIKVWCGNYKLNHKQVLETVANYSPKNFRELKLVNDSNPFCSILLEDLESFLITWKNRTPKKLLTIIIIIGNHHNLALNEENMKLIEKYNNSGIIKIEVKDMREEYFDEELGCE